MKKQTTGRAFFDTNVLIYAFNSCDYRNTMAIGLLAKGGIISVQCLNEFVSVVRRKLEMPWNDVREALQALITLCPSPESMTMNTHTRALDIAGRHGYSIFDSLIVASALEAHCAVLYSEDLHDGHTIDGLTIRNPFRRVLVS